MKHVIILLILGAFLLLIGIYILHNVDPISKDKILEYSETQGFLTDNEVIDNIDQLIEKGMIFRMLDPKNIFAFLLVFSSSFICFFSAIHISIDKMFFKKFYETPNVLAAYRRGILICLCSVGIFFLKLISSLTTYNAIAIILLCVFSELFITGIYRERNNKKQ